MKNKAYGYKTFQLSKDLSIKCHTYETRYSWGHKATAYYENREVAYSKITYYNRTWEAYTYQSIVHNIIDKLPKSIGDSKKLMYKADAIGEGRERKELGNIAMIAKMGELFTNTQKDANDWKARMLKAGLGEGVSMPDDWDTLDENEKQKRLDSAIGMLA